MFKKIAKTLKSIHHQIRSKLFYIEVGVENKVELPSLTLIFTGPDYRKIEDHREKLGFESTGEMIGWALPILDWAYLKVKEGERIGSINQDGKFTEVYAEFFDKIRPKSAPVKKRHHLYIIHRTDGPPAPQ